MQQPIAIPPHARRVDPWRQGNRGGTAADRRLGEVEVRLPPEIRDVDLAASSALSAEIEEATREIAAIDATHGEHLASLSTLLLRAESVASSKIEHVEASIDDYARALHGSQANPSAASMVASTRALDDLIHSAEHGRLISLDAVLRAHAILMAEDPSEREYAGRTRTMQNWIGGSDYSPRGAMYVPPPPDMVASYLGDVLAFANRDDISVLLQSAVVHAQFESIHPFTDGNGRIGRALVNTVLRRRKTTQRVVIPLASALVANREAYFDALNAYREGDAAPIVRSFTTAARIAASESRATAARLASMPQQWIEDSGRPRAGSAAARIIGGLLDAPVFSADEVEMRLGGSASSLYAAIERLQETGVIRPLTQRKRNQIWVAASLADELEDLGVRIAALARA